MEKLQKLCLNHLTSNLNHCDVEAKYGILDKSHFPFEEFKQSTLTFIKSITSSLYLHIKSQMDLSDLV